MGDRKISKPNSKIKSITNNGGFMACWDFTFSKVKSFQLTIDEKTFCRLQLKFNLPKSTATLLQENLSYRSQFGTEKSWIKFIIAQVLRKWSSSPTKL
jgi:hypothetical protein